MLARFFRRRSDRGSSVRTLWLFTRAGCGLCEDLRRDLEGLRVPYRWRIREVDIAASPELEARYGESIPVLWIGSSMVCKGRWEPAELRRRLIRLEAESSDPEARPPGVV